MELLEEVGPSNSVFWPQNPAPPQDLSGSLVRFRTVPSPEHGDETTSRDWLRVYRTPGGSWEAYRFGFRVVDQGPDLQWRQEPRWAKGFPEGEILYIRQRSNSTLIGPWRVGHEVQGVTGARELLPHPTANKVFEHAVRDLAPECIFSERVANGPKLDALVYAPDEAKGRPVDLATPKQLAKWLIERMLAAAGLQIIARFDREIPGWRAKVKEEIEGSSEAERQVYRSRWKRLDESINDLVFEAESAEKLLKHPTFLARIDELIATQVTSQVATRVTARVSEIESEAQRKAKSNLARLDQEVREAEARHRKVNEQCEEEEKQVRARLDAVAARERALADLQAHLEGSRERLLKDLALYQSILPGVVPQSSSTTPPPPSAQTSHPRTSAAIPAGPSITDGTIFIDSRLWPSIARWHPGVPRALAVILHAAVCGSKAVIVPSPAWARAYADSLGENAQLTVVNVQPTWLGFEDLWQGGLACCWERANRDASLIELVLLRDFNRALPQCYARPLLDTIAGYCGTLPKPAGGGWPKTLRLLACPAPQEESLPLTAEVVRHFSAVQRVPPVTGNETPKPLVEGHVTVETWNVWSSVTATPENNSELFKEFGPLARAAIAETATIAQVLRTHGMVEREAASTARDVRRSEPADYLVQPGAGAGGAR